MNKGGGYERRKIGPTSRRVVVGLLDRTLECGHCTATFRELRWKLNHERRFHEEKNTEASR